MGSASTCLAGAFGGHLGRGLRQGDRLDLVSQRAAVDRRGAARPRPRPRRCRPSRARPSCAWSQAPTPPRSTSRALLAATWEAAGSDRAGLRLRGASLASTPLPRSRPLCPGCIEVTTGGTPLVLLREHPTVGGYPVPAAVIAADLDLAAQLRPGAAVGFALVTEADALEAWPALGG